MLEYFISTHGARKGLADTALKTADSGYLTRRLVDVVQDVIVREEDCGTTQGINLSEYLDSNNASFEEIVQRVIGRFVLEPIYHPETGEVLLEANEMVTEEVAEQIIGLNITGVRFRSVLTCKTRHGVCINATDGTWRQGRWLISGSGQVIAAQSSVNRDQLTMRFHTGVASDDITRAYLG